MKKIFKKKKLELNKITIYRLGDTGMLNARGGLLYTKGDCNDPIANSDDTIISSACRIPEDSLPPPTHEEPLCPAIITIGLTVLLSYGC